MSLLSRLQHSIETLHDVAVDLDIDAYVVDDAKRRDLPGAQENLPEQLFVRQGEDGLELALYIAPTILSLLEQDNPHARLHAGNLESYCIALEGVSHFVYLAWRANMNWPVTPLEMEIQAEVDKFVTAWLLLEQQGTPRQQAARVLSRQLFDSYALRDCLDVDTSDRYHVANRVARTFCQSLALQHGKGTSALPILSAARDFHRRSLADKIRAA